MEPSITKMFYKNYFLVSMKTIKELPRHDMGTIKKTWQLKMRLREVQEGPKELEHVLHLLEALVKRLSAFAKDVTHERLHATYPQVPTEIAFVL